MSVAFSKLLRLPKESIQHCNCNMAGNCLNMTICAATTGKASFTVAAWNPMGHMLTEIVRVPVSGALWALIDQAGQPVRSQVVPLDDRTKSLPLLYLNKYGMKPDAVVEAQKELANRADHVLVFEMKLPPLGLATFSAKAAASNNGTIGTQQPCPGIGLGCGTSVESDTYALTFDESSGLLKSLRNKQSGASTSLSISWGWYNSSVGGCTQYGDDVPKSLRLPACSGQKSGAYIFRPNSSKVFYPGPEGRPSTSVVTGPFVTEVHQKFSEWASHVIRLYEGKSYVEVEWTAGPIPVDTPWLPPVAWEKHNKSLPLPNNWGKEVIVKYSSALSSKGVWYTDSNGKGWYAVSTTSVAPRTRTNTISLSLLRATIILSTRLCRSMMA